VRCPVCQYQASPAAKFCEHCGEQFPNADLSGEGERRHLTVMFCDLVGSTPLAATLDPEDLHALLRRYQETCARVVTQYDGYIAQYLGDGLLVFFGYPRAHEDDAQRAAHAGLGMLEALARLDEALEAERGIRLSARIGIHSGSVVVGKIGGDERRPKQVFGHTVNLTERLQGLAEPDSIAVSAETLRLLGGRFITADLGSHALKGVDAPVAVHRVLGPADPREQRRDAGVIRTPLIGRKQEVALLLDRWEHATEGVGQVVLLSGDPGMGKSRLVQVLRERLAREPHAWLECNGSVYRENSALYPVVDLVEQGFDLSRDDSPEQKVEKIERELEEKGLPLAANVPLFTDLLSLPRPDRYPALGIRAEAQRRRTLVALGDWLVAVAEKRPVVVVVEDLHWLDPSTLELLGSLIDRSPAARLLLLLTYRPVFEAPWGSRSHLSRLVLHRLTRRQIAEMVEGVTAGRRLPDEVLRQVVAKTDGVPLFVEELTKAVLESDLLEPGEQHYEVSRRHLALAIPSTLADSLTARLDRLGPAKELAELASVLGRKFSHELLAAAVSPASPEADLARLVSAELLYRRGDPPHATYRFKHALIQEQAYQSLLKSTCQEFHGRVAAVLEARFPERVESEPEELARHHAGAGHWEEAVRYYERAGERATLRSAYTEAVAHLSSGIEALGRIPASSERDRQELALRISLGPPLIGTRGYGDPEVETIYTRARELSETVGDTPQLFESVWGLANYQQARARLALAMVLGQELVEIAEGAGDPQLLSWSHLQSGATRFWRGEYAESLTHLEQAITSYDPAEYWFLPGAPDPYVAAQVYAGLVLWQLGQTERAVEASREGLRAARERRHPFSLGIALCFNGSLHQQRGDAQAAREVGEEVIPVATEHDFPLWRGWGGLVVGWSRARTGEGDRGVEVIQGALAEIAETSSSLGAPAALMMLADAQLVASQWGDAAATAAGALALAEQLDHHAWDAELRRLRGVALLEERGSDDPEVERCLWRAYESARGEESKPYELRAATSLCRLLNQRGIKEEARALLAGAVGRFPDDPGSPDLPDARELLRKLS
jgi:class 3 adenylate cyclase/tetratricopeptide (TPR) repeat protein